MSTHVNELSHAELERIGILVEELGEVCQVLGKVLRHGLEASNPNLKHAPTNRQDLEKELGDLKNATNMLVEEEMVSQAAIDARADYKSATIDMWLHYLSKHPIRRED